MKTNLQDSLQRKEYNDGVLTPADARRAAAAAAVDFNQLKADADAASDVADLAKFKNKATILYQQAVVVKAALPIITEKINFSTDVITPLMKLINELTTKKKAAEAAAAQAEAAAASTSGPPAAAAAGPSRPTALAALPPVTGMPILQLPRPPPKPSVGHLLVRAQSRAPQRSPPPTPSPVDEEMKDAVAKSEAAAAAAQPVAAAPPAAAAAAAQAEAAAQAAAQKEAAQGAASTAAAAAPPPVAAGPEAASIASTASTAGPAAGPAAPPAAAAAPPAFSDDTVTVTGVPPATPGKEHFNEPIYGSRHMPVLEAIAKPSKEQRIEQIYKAIKAAQGDKIRENENMNKAVKAATAIVKTNPEAVGELFKGADSIITTTKDIANRAPAVLVTGQAVTEGGAIEEDQYTPEKLNEMYERIINISKELLKNNDNFEKLKSNFTTYNDVVKIDLLTKEKLETNDKNEIKTIFNKYLLEQSPILKKNITENTNKIVSDITQNVNSVAEILKQFETQGIRWAKLERSSLIKDMEALIQTLNNNDKRMKYDIDYYTLQYKIKTGQIEAGEIQEQLTAVENRRIQVVGAEKDRADAEAARLRAEKENLVARTTSLESQQKILKDNTDTLNNLQVNLKKNKDILRKLNELLNIIEKSNDTTLYSVLKDYLEIFNNVRVLKSGRTQTRQGTITTSLLKDVIDIEETKTKIRSHIEEIEADIKQLDQDIQRATDNYNNFVAQISKPLQGAAAGNLVMDGGQNGEPPVPPPQKAAITAPVAAPGAAARAPNPTLGEPVSETPNKETREKIIESIDDSKLKLKALADKFVNIATKVKRSTNPTYATLNSQDQSLYIILYQNYLDRISRATDENIRQEKAAAARELVEGLRENNLIPSEVLKVSTTDKVVFIFTTLFIRLIALSIIETLVEKGKVTTSNIAIAGYIGLFTILLIALMLFVNLDMYRLRIVFNYINFHANSANFYLYLLMLWVFGGVILYVAYYLNKDLNIQSTNEETKLRLIYRIQVVSLIIWLFLSLLVFII